MVSRNRHTVCVSYAINIFNRITKLVLVNLSKSYDYIHIFFERKIVVLKKNY